MIEIGIVGDYVKGKIIGAHVKDAGETIVKEIKAPKKEEPVCSYCGLYTKNLIAVCTQIKKSALAYGHPQFARVGVDTDNKYSYDKVFYRLCKYCAKECRLCHKFYCPEHIKKHECNYYLP